MISKVIKDYEAIYKKWGETQDKAQISATMKSYSTIKGTQTGLINILSQYSMILSNAEDHGLMGGNIGFVITENDDIVFVAFIKIISRWL